MNHNSIIIVNYNSGHFLCRCITTVLEKSNEVIIVDNASTDNSIVQCLTQWPNQSNLHIINNLKNLGFATACNIGYQHAQYDTILFLNPDCELESNSLQILSNTLYSHSNIGMVGGLLLNPNGSEQQGARRAIPTPWRAFVRTFKLYYLKKYSSTLFFDFHLHNQLLPKNAIDVEAISGACMLVKREAIEDVGLWDEAYFLHCEDLDWCFRFQKKNWRILFQPHAKIHHALGVCSQSRPFFVEWHKHKGMLRFYQKFFQKNSSILFMPFIFLGVSLRFLLVVLHLISHTIITQINYK